MPMGAGPVFRPAPIPQATALPRATLPRISAWVSPCHYTALMLKVTVAVYAPVEYAGSSVSDHTTVPASPAPVDLASAPKPTTLVAADVDAVSDPTQGVPEA